MKQMKTKYTDEPVGDLVRVEDFLPPPEVLAAAEQNVKVTISLKKSSVEFFKRVAQERRSSYKK